MPVLPDSSPETQYTRKLGKKLVAAIPSQYSWPFEFHVIPQKDINAFALPGGPMFVNVGTITAAANEAELAGVMAHEISHVYMQHSAKQAGKTQTTSEIARIAGTILGTTTSGVFGSLAQAGIQFMADFFKKLAAEGSTGPQFLSDHPNPGNREAAIQKEIATCPRKAYSTPNPTFNAVRRRATSFKMYSGQEIAQGAKSGEWGTSRTALCSRRRQLALLLPHRTLTNKL